MSKSGFSNYSNKSVLHFNDELCHCFDNFTLSLNVAEYQFDSHGQLVEDLTK